MNAADIQQKKEKTALNISLAGGSVFVILELLMSLYTHSQAVMLDAIYDGVELVMILLSLSLIPLLYKPFNEKHPFGFLQVESLFIVIKGFMMSAVTIGLILNNVEIFLQGGRKIAFSKIAYFELFAAFLSIFVIFLLKRMNQKITSPMVEMEIQGWKIDAAASLGLSVAFFLPMLISTPWFDRLTPYLDQVVAIILSICMLPTPIRSVITGLRDLFLLAPEEETVESIKTIITPILLDHGYERLYYDIVRTGRKIWISVYITFDREWMSVSQFVRVQALVIEALREEYQDFYFELLPDIEYKEENQISDREE